MEIVAWVAVGVFVLNTGVAIERDGPYGTKSECETANSKVVQNIAKAEPGKILAFGLTCTEIKVSDGGKPVPGKPSTPQSRGPKLDVDDSGGRGIDGRLYL